MSNQGPNVTCEGGGAGQMNRHKPLYVLVFRLLIGVFLLWSALFISGFVASGPGREKYFLLIFTLVFAIAGLIIVVTDIKQIKNYHTRG